MNRQCKGVPKFSNAAEERVFWETHDSTEYLDWNKTQKAVLPDLKPTTKTISCVCLSICWTRSRPRLMEILSNVVYGALIRRRFSDGPSSALRLRF